MGSKVRQILKGCAREGIEADTVDSRLCDQLWDWGKLRWSHEGLVASPGVTEWTQSWNQTSHASQIRFHGLNVRLCGGGFVIACEDVGRRLPHYSPSALYVSLFFFKLYISSRTLISTLYARMDPQCLSELRRLWPNDP